MQRLHDLLFGVYADALPLIFQVTLNAVFALFNSQTLLLSVVFGVCVYFIIMCSYCGLVDHIFTVTAIFNNTWGFFAIFALSYYFQLSITEK